MRSSPKIRRAQNSGSSASSRKKAATWSSWRSLTRRPSKTFEKYKADLAALTDPRKTTEEQAQKIIHTSKPIYWITSGIHSPETGGPQMLVELAYRLIVEESLFIQTIRNNAIVFITPVVETDGRDKEVDTYYYGKKTKKPRPPMMYWGKYVAHDNNRDGMGQYLHLTQNITAGVLEWHPTILHDLHEAQSYLYVSTGTGPYNPCARSNCGGRVVDAGRDRDYGDGKARRFPAYGHDGFYDGWVPNYLFWIAETHNSFGAILRGAISTGPTSRRSSINLGRQRPPVASGTGQILLCRSSSGARETIRIFRNLRFFLHLTRSRKKRICISKTTGSRTSDLLRKERTVRYMDGPFQLSSCIASTRPRWSMTCSTRASRSRSPTRMSRWAV